MLCIMEDVINRYDVRNEECRKKIVRIMKGVTNKDGVNIMKGVVNNLQFQDELYVN